MHYCVPEQALNWDYATAVTPKNKNIFTTWTFIAFTDVEERFIFCLDLFFVDLAGSWFDLYLAERPFEDPFSLLWL